MGSMSGFADEMVKIALLEQAGRVVGYLGKNPKTLAYPGVALGSVAVWEKAKRMKRAQDIGEAYLSQREQ